MMYCNLQCLIQNKKTNQSTGFLTSCLVLSLAIVKGQKQECSKIFMIMCFEPMETMSVKKQYLSLIQIKIL